MYQRGCHILLKLNNDINNTTTTTTTTTNNNNNNNNIPMRHSVCADADFKDSIKKRSPYNCNISMPISSNACLQ